MAELSALSKQYYPAPVPFARSALKPRPFLSLTCITASRRCYPTRRLLNDGSYYYGPFPSLPAAERFAAEFLDFFKTRRCVEDLEPDPSHPGCIYSQMKMCLAPCFAACTDDEYRNEVGRVMEFLDGKGQSLLRSLAQDRSQASEALEFEQAAKTHARIEKLNEILRQPSELVRNLHDLHALIMQRGAEENHVLFFRVWRGELRGPATLSLDEKVPSPVPLDQQLQSLLGSLAGDIPLSVPLWEHLSLLARWFYSSFREGELIMLEAEQTIPHTRLIRLCRKLLLPKESNR